ncbi:hypothetical protein WIW50_19045 [Flavobacteriaceae bacterium 3-367]
MEGITRSLVCFLGPLALLFIFPQVEQVSANIVYGIGGMAYVSPFFVYLTCWLIFLYLAKMSHHYMATTTGIQKVYVRISTVLAMFLLATCIIALIVSTILVVGSF